MWLSQHLCEGTEALGFSDWMYLTKHDLHVSCRGQNKYTRAMRPFRRGECRTACVSFTAICRGK